MSVRGRSEEGYILLDILVALMVAVVGFGSVFAALRTGTDYSVRLEEKILLGMERRNGRTYEMDNKLAGK